MSSETVRLHQVLCVAPRQGLIRQRQVKLPDISTHVLFATPGALRDGRPIRGMILCHIVGDDHLDSATEALVRTRLSAPEHDCPGRHVDTSRYLWARSHQPEEWR